MGVRAETKPLRAPLAGGREGASVVVEPILTGTMECPASVHRERLRGADPAHARRRHAALARIGSSRSPPTWSAIRSPGRSSSTRACTRRWPRSRSPISDARSPDSRRPKIEPGEDLPAQLRAKGVDPKSMRLVVMTHLHFDHTSGMSDFPGATFVITEAEWTAAADRLAPAPARLPPPALRLRASTTGRSATTSDAVSSYATFGRTFDLFGDGSVRLASTPGHSAGHQSVICRLRDRDLVIAGDAIYTIGQLDDAPEPPRPFDRTTGGARCASSSHFARTYPQAVILPGHDPEHWKTVQDRYE